MSKCFEYFVRKLEPWAVESRDIPPVSTGDQSISLERTHCATQGEGNGELVAAYGQG